LQITLYIENITKQKFGGDSVIPRPQAIIDFIRDYHHQYPPTLREIATGVGVKSNAMVHLYLTKWVNQGLMERRANCPRCITLTESRL